MSLVLPEDERLSAVRGDEVASSGSEGEPKVDCQLVELVTLGGGTGGTSGFGREESRSLRLRRRWLELAIDAERCERTEPSKEARPGVWRSSAD